MKKKIADKWIAALKSKKFKQGRWRLKTPDGYCCLGVLCEIAKEEGVVNEIVIQDKTGIYSGYIEKTDDQSAQGRGAFHALSDHLMEWSGMKHNMGKVVMDGEEKFLANFNDYDNYSFEQIAEVIEKNYKKL